jgi:TP901 family phage tail tape measure protein
MTEVDSLILRITADAAMLKKELMVADKAVKSFAAKTAASMKAAGASMMKMGRTMSMFVTAPILALGAGAVLAFAQFNTAMTNSTAIMSGVSAEIRREMEATANSIASSTVTSATKAAEAYFYLASAGMDAATAIRALPKVNEFAIAGNFDMALATDLLTDAQSALGLNVGTTTMKMAQMARVSDVLVRANTLANATVQQFSTALTSKAGAALKSFNKDVEEGAAVLAAMADQGIKAELAGTSLDRMVRLLSQSSIKNRKDHEELGFAVFDSAGKMRNFADIIGNLETITAGMSDETKVATLAQLGFDARVQQTILPLLGTADAIAKYEKELRKASGYTSSVAAKNQMDFASKMKMTWNQMVLVAKEIGEKLVPYLEDLGEWVEAQIDWWNGLSESWKNTILLIGGIVAVAGPLLLIFGATLSVLASMITAYGVVTTAIFAQTGATTLLTAAQWAFNAAAAMNPYVLMAIGIMAAVAALVIFIRHMQGAADIARMAAKAAKDQIRLNEAWVESQNKQMENDVASLMAIKDKKKAEEEYNLMVKASARNAEAKAENIRTEKNLLMVLDKERRKAFEGEGSDRGTVEEIDELIKLSEEFVTLQEGQLELLEEQAAEYERMNQLRIIANQDEADLAAGRDIRAELIEDETKAIEEQNEALKESVATYGMSASQIEIYRAKLKGATDGQLGHAQAMADENDAMEAQLEAMEEAETAKQGLIDKEKELVETTKSMNKALDDQIATYGMTTTQLAVYKAEQEGLSAIDVEIIRYKSEKLQALKDEEKVLKDSADAAKKLQKDGENLTKSMRKPAEKMADAQEKLKEMLEQGAIDVETYARAMEKLDKDMKVKVSFKVSGIDAVAAGSLEAMARVEEFRALAEGKAPKVNHREAGAAQVAAGQAVQLAELMQEMGHFVGNSQLLQNVGAGGGPPPIANGGMQPVHPVFTNPLKPNDMSPAGVEIPEELRETRDTNQEIADHTAELINVLGGSANF